MRSEPLQIRARLRPPWPTSTSLLGELAAVRAKNSVAQQRDKRIPAAFQHFSALSLARFTSSSTGCHSARMAHMFFPMSKQQDAASTSPVLPAAFVLAGNPAAPKMALLLSYAYSGALRGACFPFPQGRQAGRGCCARERM